MELIYSMRRKPLKCEPPQLDSVTESEVTQPIVTISSGNIIAFSSYTELSDCDGDSWGGHVYVCDLDTPWDSHKVTTTAHPVSAVEWDAEGKQLLVATSAGEVAVFTMREYLLNDWVCCYTASFPGEHIIKAIFFHNGRRIVMNDKKADSSILITDRCQQQPTAPTLRGFGGSWSEGACVVTGTGLVCAVLPPSPSASAPASAAGAPSPPPPRATTLTECLRATRDRITAASIAHKNGNLLVSVAVAARGGSGGGGGGRCVRSVLLSVRRASLHAQPLPSLYLDHCPVQPSLTWCVREDTEYLLVASRALSLWKLTERAHPVHKYLIKGPVASTTPPGAGVQKPGQDCYNTVVWCEVGSWGEAGAGGAGAVCAARGGAGAVCAALCRRGVLHLLPRDKLLPMCSVSVPTGGGDAGAATPPKKAKYGAALGPVGSVASVSCMDMSHLGGVLVAVDSHSQLYVYKLPQPWNDIPTPLSIQHAGNMLEYAMVTGYDCLDVLLTLRPAALDALYDRVTESFQRQPQVFQQYYYQSWLSLRAALCRCSASGQGAASALACLQLAHSAWAALEGALRAADTCAPDLLAALLADHHHPLDLDKALVSLETKEVWCDAGSVQALRRVLQRACDTALHVLATVGHAAPAPAHGYALWSDPRALGLLRRCVAVARGVGGVRSATHPALEGVGRALSRLAALPPGASPPQDLLEECALLAAMAPVPRLWESLPRCCVSAPRAAAPRGLQFEYGVTPEWMRYSPEPPASVDAAPAQPMDAIRYMYLGGGGRGVRCGRCGARALPAAPYARHAAQRAYDARYLASCRCGGKWTLESNV